jgi:hypothetical protein
MTRVLAALLASLLAASCSEVRSSVTVSHMLPAPAGKTIVIVPYGPGLALAPEYQDYVGKLAAHLRSKGYTVVPPQPGQAAAADQIAFFHFSVDGQTLVNPYVSVAVPRTGSIISYGLRSPYGHGTRSIYTRTVILEIFDRARFNPNEPASFITARVYSGWVKSDGACSTMAPVIDPMLVALFADFPGQSSASRTIALPADSTCGASRYG